MSPYEISECHAFLVSVEKTPLYPLQADRVPDHYAVLPSHALVPLVTSLPMPEDGSLAELRELTAIYIAGITTPESHNWNITCYTRPREQPILESFSTYVFNSRTSSGSHYFVIVINVHVFGTKVTVVRRGCFPFMLSRETIYNSEVVTSSWRPWMKTSVCILWVPRLCWTAQRPWELGELIPLSCCCVIVYFTAYMNSQFFQPP